MTAKRRLVSRDEVKALAQTLRDLGCTLDGPIDIRADGVTFYPKGEAPPTPGNDFERWQAQDARRDENARRP